VSTPVPPEEVGPLGEKEGEEKEDATGRSSREAGEGGASVMDVELDGEEEEVQEISADAMPYGWSLPSEAPEEGEGVEAERDDHEADDAEEEEDLVAFRRRPTTVPITTSAGSDVDIAASRVAWGSVFRPRTSFSGPSGDGATASADGPRGRLGFGTRTTPTEASSSSAPFLRRRWWEGPPCLAPSGRKAPRRISGAYSHGARRSVRPRQEPCLPRRRRRGGGGEEGEGGIRWRDGAVWETIAWTAVHRRGTWRRRLPTPLRLLLSL